MKIVQPKWARSAGLAVACVVGGSAAVASAMVVADVRGRAADVQAIGEQHTTPVALPPLAIFARAQTPAERAAARNGAIADEIRVLTGVAPAVPSGFDSGAPRADQLRIAASDLGTGKRTVYLIRTTRGRVCAGATDFTAGCLAELPRDLPVDVTHGGGNDGEGPIVWGVARDDVRRVKVVYDGTLYEASVGENAFFFQLSARDADADLFEALRVTLANGDVVVVPIT